MGSSSSMVWITVLVLGLLSCVCSLDGPTFGDLELELDKLLVVHYNYTDSSPRNYSVVDSTDKYGGQTTCVDLVPPEDGKYSSHLCKGYSPSVFVITYANGQQKSIVADEYEMRMTPPLQKFKFDPNMNHAQAQVTHSSEGLFSCNDESMMCRLRKLVKLSINSGDEVRDKADTAELRQKLIDEINEELLQQNDFITLSFRDRSSIVKQKSEYSISI